MSKYLGKSERSNNKIRLSGFDKFRTYKLTLSRVRSSLPPISKQFSIIIHQPVIENVSDLLEKTVARPSGILGSGVIATIGLLIMIYSAKNFGFALSGSEFILLLILGWVVGLLVEFIWRRLVR